MLWENEYVKIQSNFIDLLREKKPKANSEWAELVGELTDFLNSTRGEYGPWTPKFVGQKVAYIKRTGGLGELRFFVSQVREKGGWWFWYVTSPKKEGK